MSMVMNIQKPQMLPELFLEVHFSCETAKGKRRPLRGNSLCESLCMFRGLGFGVYKGFKTKLSN